MIQIPFTVWAPLAEVVEIFIRNKKIPMEKGKNGWWSRKITVDENSPDYYFSINHGKPLPDPMSYYQPDGVHGPSRYLDHSDFTWEDHGFNQEPLKEAVIYELHVGTFTPHGTFTGCIEKLDYLRDLGITHIELMPVAEFSGDRGWGYDGVDLFAPHHAYGGPAGLKQFINACHKKGLAVIFDVVYNHLGPEGNYLHMFGPYFTDTYKTPWGPAVNLDGPYSHEVRNFFINNADMWFRHYHADGLRIDAVHALHDMSAIHFLEELSLYVKKLGSEFDKKLVLIAESDLNDPKIVRSRKKWGFGINAQWNDDFHHALHALLTGERDGYYSDFGKMEHLVKTLKKIFVYTGQYSFFRKKHHGREIHESKGKKFIVYSDNHDQSGNRARGDRLYSLIGPEYYKIAAALVFTSPFVPMLFQGGEWGTERPFLYFTDHQDATLANAVKQGRREEFSEFGWSPEDIPDPQDINTYTSSVLNWEEQCTPPHNDLLDWHKKLISLRKKYKSLSSGDPDKIKIDFSENADWMRIKRGTIYITYNLSYKSLDLPLQTKKNINILLSSSEDIRINNDLLSLPGKSVIIINSERD